MFVKIEKLNFYVSYNKFGLVQVYNQCNELIKEIKLEMNIHALAINDECKVVVACLTNIFVYDYPDFNLITIIDAKTLISSIDIGGSILIVGSKCGDVCLNNLKTNESTFIINIESQIVQTQVIDAINLFSFLTFHGKIYFYKNSTLSLCQTFDVYTTNCCYDLINYMCFSREGELLALYSLNQVHFYNKSLGRSIAKIEVFENINSMYLTSVHTCKAGQYITTSSNNGFIFVHDFIKKNLIFKFFILDIDNCIVLEKQIMFQTKTNQEEGQIIDIYLADPFSDEKCECVSQYLIKAKECNNNNLFLAYKRCVKNKFEYNKNLN